MKKRRIVIASILKPVDDTRMFEKMGASLEQSGDYDVSIIGYPAARIPAKTNIHFLPLGTFKRLSLRRVLATWKVFRIIRQVKPHLLIVNTHELLIVAILNRILFGTKIVYDVRENYYRNILYTDAFPGVLRPAIALWVRLKEKLSTPLLDAFLLAESSYLDEMKFFHGKATVIENKAIVHKERNRERKPDMIRLLFSGTLAESTGVFQAIKLAKGLHAINSGIRLNILGYCALPDTLRKIQSEIHDHTFISLKGDSLVQHTEIIDAIFDSDFGVVYYPPSSHTENSIPTKLYEYLAGRLPILMQANPKWLALTAPIHACIPVDFERIDSPAIINQMSGSFYSGPAVGTYWSGEAEKLLAVLSMI